MAALVFLVPATLVTVGGTVVAQTVGGNGTPEFGVDHDPPPGVECGDGDPAELTFDHPVTVDDDLFERPMSYADQRQSAVDSQGRIYLTAVQPRDAGDRDGAHRHVVVHRSTDSGESWSELAVVSAHTGPLPVRSGSLAVDGRDRLHVVFYDSDSSEDAIWYRRYSPSTDTWSPALSSQARAIAQPEGDHPTIVVDPNDDDFLLVAWDGLRYATSSDGGDTWASPRSFGDGGATARPVPLILANGNWLISTGPEQRFSADQGDSWNRVAALDGDARFRGYATNVRDADDTIHVVYQADVGNGVTEIRYATANPDGTGWSSPVSIAPRAGWFQNFPGITVDRSDTLHVTWFESDDYPGSPYQDSPAGVWLGKEVKVMSKPDRGSWAGLQQVGAGAADVWPNLSYNNQLPGDDRIMLTYGSAPPTGSDAVIAVSCVGVGAGCCIT